MTQAANHPISIPFETLTSGFFLPGILPENSQGTTFTVFTPNAHLFPLRLMTYFPAPSLRAILSTAWSSGTGGTCDLKPIDLFPYLWSEGSALEPTHKPIKTNPEHMARVLLERQEREGSFCQGNGQPDSERKHLRGGRTEKHPDPRDSQEASISIYNSQLGM